MSETSEKYQYTFPVGSKQAIDDAWELLARDQENPDLQHEVLFRVFAFKEKYLAWENERRVARAVKYFKQEDDPLILWLKENCIVDEMLREPCGTLYLNYFDWTQATGLIPLTRLRFVNMLLIKSPTIRQQWVCLDGKDENCYIGIGLRLAAVQEERRKNETH
jgi:hypothetical protein